MHTHEVTAPGASASAHAAPPETTAWPDRLRQLEAQQEVDRERLAEMAKMIANFQAKVDALTRDNVRFEIDIDGHTRTILPIPAVQLRPVRVKPPPPIRVQQPPPPLRVKPPPPGFASAG